MLPGRSRPCRTSRQARWPRRGRPRRWRRWPRRRRGCTGWRRWRGRVRGGVRHPGGDARELVPRLSDGRRNSWEHASQSLTGSHVSGLQLLAARMESVAARQENERVVLGLARPGASGALAPLVGHGLTAAGAELRRVGDVVVKVHADRTELGAAARLDLAATLEPWTAGCTWLRTDGSQPCGPRRGARSRCRRPSLGRSRSAAGETQRRRDDARRPPRPGWPERVARAAARAPRPSCVRSAQGRQRPRRERGGGRSRRAASIACTVTGTLATTVGGARSGG